MDRLIEDFLQDCKIRGMSPRTLPGYKSAVKSFDQFLNAQDITILDVDKEVLRDFIEYMRNGRQVAPRTLELIFSVLSSFYEYLVYEGHVMFNPILPVRKRYLRSFKKNHDNHERKLVSLEDMTRLINSCLDIRDKAIIALLAKTGIRRSELITLDLDDVDFVEQKIRLKPTAKRTNRTIFFDDETAFILRRWIRIREGMNHLGSSALFISGWGDRISRNGVYLTVTKAAERIGLHNSDSDRMEDHFSPHCCRHWFTTHLRRAGMPREFIQELRGDARREAIDIYDHIDKKELKESYLVHIPRLGI
ncbi:MAG: tyrosine-type recombinase/integrase [Methanotrichaceae archaeon]|nr:tyrosine-type recombinase/integrase [Methanotrichaceae archaeon]